MTNFSVPRRRPGASSAWKWAPAFAGALMFVAPAHAQSTRAGDYDGSQMELATALRLEPDGHFKYMLSYGALDELARGRWSEHDGKVWLTTEPPPTPPRFVLVSDTPTRDGNLYVTLDKPELMGALPLTVGVQFAGDPRPRFLDADEDGRVPLPAGKVPVGAVPDLPVYSIPFVPHPLTPGGHKLVFHFKQNSLGVADFREEPLTIDGDALVMTRYDRTIRFKKGQP